MDLFDQNLNKENNSDNNSPLAYRMRPEDISDIVGQDEILSKNKFLYKAIKSDNIQSMIFYGPPGSGKTSLAHVIAKKTSAVYKKINAVTSGVKEIRKVINEAGERLKLYNKSTILFIDEIHRFNKSQQDALLPAVEAGKIIMIGATTENPYFEVNSPLLSRSRVIEFRKLKTEELIKIIKNALNNKNRGLYELNIDIEAETIKFIEELSGGDARVALNTLESVVLISSTDSNGKIKISKDLVAESLQKKILNYDKGGDNHYDTISAFIKSMRGSDPDATLFWLAKMLEAGEDPKFIARRLIVHAAEDVGLADPMALIVANSAVRAVEFLGLPEARIPLAEAALYIATADKSNSVIKGIDSAINYVKNHDIDSIPFHLKDAHYAGAEKLGHGLDYKYPHNYKYNYVKQDYLPGNVENIFYNPGNNMREKEIEKRLDFLKKLVEEE